MLDHSADTLRGFLHFSQLISFWKVVAVQTISFLILLPLFTSEMNLAEMLVREIITTVPCKYTFCYSLPENILSLTATANSLTQKYIHFIQ